MIKKSKSTTVFFLILCILLQFATVWQVNAKVFEAFDHVSLKAAIDSVNIRSGGDTIKITGNITLTAKLPNIKKDLTITAETNSDGTPKYFISGNSQYTGIEIYNDNCTVENLIIKQTSNWNLYCEIKKNGSFENIITMEVAANPGIIVEIADSGATIKINKCNTSNSPWQGLAIGTLYDSSTDLKITISNCISNNNHRNGIYLWLGKSEVGKSEVSIINCETNSNGAGGIFIDGRTTIDKVLIISNCITNNNGSSGIQDVIIGTAGEINNCTANGNESSGFILGERSIINNCKATGNDGWGFEFGKMSKLNNCTAIGNKFGFSGEVSQLNNCIVANGKGEWDFDEPFGYGFVLYNCIVNNCFALNDYNGFYLHYCILSNSTAAYNKQDGIYCSSSIGINNTSCYNNWSGIESGNIYNSISYGNGTDWRSGYSDSKLYNSVYKTGSSSNTENCSTNDPKLQPRNGAGDFTDFTEEIAYFSLGEGSSAIELADMNLINKEELWMGFSSSLTLEETFWLENIITEEYIVNILTSDYLGNARLFNGDKYDAGSIAGNTGEGTNSFITYNPKKVGNYGETTLTFYGKDLDETVKISLQKQGENEIIADTIVSYYSQTANTNKCYATFNVHNRKLGKWDIVVDYGDKIETIKEGFELETYREPKIEIEIMGRDDIRSGRWCTYTIKYTNTGNTEAYMNPIIIEIITEIDAKVSIKEHWEYASLTPVTFDTTGMLGHTDIFRNRKSTFIAPNILYIPPYGKGYLLFDVHIEGIAQNIEISAVALNPLVVTNPDSYINKMVDPEHQFADHPCPNHFNTEPMGCIELALSYAYGQGMDIAGVFVPGLGCAQGLVEVACGTVRSAKYVNENAISDDQLKSGIGSSVKAGALAMAECIVSIFPPVSLAWTLFKTVKRAMDFADAWDEADCGDNAKRKGRLVTSWDPNDKIGPVSESGSTAFNNRTEFTYIINFENDPELATAPAQEVRIIDTLDLNVFDINSFEAGFLNIGGRVIETPFAQQNCKWTVDMRPAMDLITEVTLKLDKPKGIATWYFISIDPATGNLPDDPLVGFLPPNDENGAGQGSVIFTIKLKEGVPDDLVVANRATIIFDNNPPIITPTWENKKDVIPPASTLLRAIAINDTLVELRWTGSDNPGGSGIYCYDIYMKPENGNYERIITKSTNESATVIIEKDVKYALYSIATDHAGNREKEKTKPDITIPEENLPFDIYVVTKWNNTFMLNLRKLADDGFDVTACKWFKNNEVVGENFSYSAGTQITDLLETGVVYYFQIETSLGTTRYSTNKIIEHQKGVLRAYPNPVPQGNNLTIEGTTQGSLVEVYNYMGACISRTIATGNITVLMLALPEGIYILRSENEAVKIIVN